MQRWNNLRKGFAIFIVTFIPMLILYVKLDDFYKFTIQIENINELVKYENDEQHEQSDWKFFIDKTYKLQKLNVWTPLAMVEPEDTDKPGEMGEAYDVPEDKINLAYAMNKSQNYNVFASAAISLNRSLPDVRPQGCSDLAYRPKLPDTSVIIIYHNEALPTILRTLYSIIERSPRSLLKEIILVDDFSDIENYGNILQKFIELLPVETKLIRSGKRIGLVRARLLGAKHAAGTVLTFLDSHIECTIGWLEPLLNQIANNRSTVVCPMVDMLTVDSFRYVPLKVSPIGFHWYLELDWDPMPYKNFDELREDKTKPFSSPSMIGCAFAIDREFFFEIGSYDEGMDIWGAENLELSLRVWQCGGSLEIIPCSHVGHLYRKSAYSFDGNKSKIIYKNNIRVAEVWMDEYKEFYYNYLPDARNLISSVGDLDERKALRHRLKCKSFRWYLENVYPEATMNSEPLTMGQISNVEYGMCLDVAEANDHLVFLERCIRSRRNQEFVYTKDNRILKTNTLCVAADLENDLVYSTYCADKNEKLYWIYDEKSKAIIEMHSRKCLGILVDDADDGGLKAQLLNCTDSQNQKWIINEI